MNLRVKALSLWQPHADLIALGHKTIETRSWPTRYRGQLLICAAKTWNIQVRTSIDCYKDAAICQENLAVQDALLPPDYTPRLGEAVALGELIDCIELKNTDAHIKASCVGSPEGLFGFVLSNVVALEPFPVKGRQGFFDVDINKGDINKEIQGELF